MDYYVYWNAQQVVDVLNAIAGIMNSGAYTGIVRAMGVLGLMAAALAGIWRLNRLTESIGLYWMGLTLVYLGLLVPTTTVIVRDMRAGTATPVANVPIGIGVFASELSHIGHWLTNAYETAFVPPATNDVNRFGRFGFQGPQRVLDAATRAQLQAPVVTAMLNAVMTDCVIPELLDTPGKIAEMRQNPDVLALIASSGWVNPARTTTLTYSATNDAAQLLGGTGLITGPVACDQATARLNASIDAAVKRTINQYALQIQPGHSLLASTATPGTLSQIGALINGATGGADTILTGSSRTAADIVKQAAAMQGLESAAARAMASPGATEVAMSVAVANRSSSIQYETMATVAQEALPKLRNAVELIIIASWPIVGLILIMAGSKMVRILQSYLVMVLWVQLWAPLYAVVNYMMISADATPYTRAMALFGGGTPEAMTMIAQLGATSQQVGGMLALAIPAIALALAKGGEVAATNMISTVMGPSTSAAGSSGGQLAQGNISVGNTSWGNSSEYNSNAGNVSWGNTGTGNLTSNNASAQKQDLSSSWADPQTSTRSTPHGSYITDGDGKVTGMQGAPWSVGGTAGGSTAMNRANTNTSTESEQARTGRAASLDLSSAATSSNRASADFARQLTRALATGVGTNGQWVQNWSGGATGTASTETGGQQTLQNQESLKFNSRAGFGGNVGASQQYGPFGDGAQGGATPGGPDGTKKGPVMGRRAAAIDVGAGADATTAQAAIDAATNKNGTVDQKTASRAAQVVMAAANSVMQNTTDSGVRTAGQQFVADLQKAVKAGEQRSASVQTERSAGNTRQDGTQNQVGGNMSLGAPVAQQLLAMAGGDAGKALALAANPQAVAQATRDAAAGMKASEGSAFLTAGGAEQPRTPAEVRAQGNSDVDRLNGQARGAVQQADAGNKHSIAGRQHAGPTSTPDTTPATNAFNAGAGGAYAAYLALSGDAAFNKGANSVAAAMYKDNQQGMGTVLANTFAFGMGYSSPQEYQKALTAAAASNPQLAATLVQVGKSDGGQISPQQMESIQSGLKAFEDAQPGFFSQFVDKVRGK